MAIYDSSPEAVLTKLLACPVCHADVELDEWVARCSACGRRYSSIEGVVDFTPQPPPDPEVGARWGLWEQLERNGCVSYENDPHNNLSVGDRDDCAAFAQFADLEGRILDVGCGPQRLPAYARDCPGVFVGIDPLLGELPRQFAFVRGIGEYLPFRSDSFDRVLFATSLDHTLAPTRALAEARRVVKPSGSVVLWIGEKRATTSAKSVRESQAWYESLAVPDGADDRFHAVRLDRTLMQAHLAEAGLEIDELRDNEFGNIFARARTR